MNKLPNFYEQMKKAVNDVFTEAYEEGYQKGWNDCNDHNEKLRKWNDEHKE